MRFSVSPMYSDRFVSVQLWQGKYAKMTSTL